MSDIRNFFTKKQKVSHIGSDISEQSSSSNIVELSTSKDRGRRKVKREARTFLRIVMLI